MLHLGYTMKFCETCKILANHRIIEVRADGEAMLLRLCCTCHPEVKTAPVLRKEAAK